MRAAAQRYDVERVRRDFPILARDGATAGRSCISTAPPPRSARARCSTRSSDYETHSHANVHRGVHALSQEATEAFEGARERVRRFINAALDARDHLRARHDRGDQPRRAVATRGTRFEAGRRDPDHRARASRQHRAVADGVRADRRTLKVAPINRRGELMFDEFAAAALAAHEARRRSRMSPMRSAPSCRSSASIEAAHAHGALGADRRRAGRAAHAASTCSALDCDFYAFSGHKLYGPTGIGVLYGREALLDAMPPWQGGGDMIRTVTFEQSTYNELPWKFEAGTPQHLRRGRPGRGDGLRRGPRARARSPRTSTHCSQLATAELQQHARHRDHRHRRRTRPPCSRSRMEGVHPHDLGTILDHEGVAIRTGHHCAMPVMDFFGLPATARASFGCYNTARRRRRARGRRSQGCARCSADGTERSLPRRDPRSQQAAAQFRPLEPRRRAARTATTRCAATG